MIWQTKKTKTKIKFIMAMEYILLFIADVIIILLLHKKTNSLLLHKKTNSSLLGLFQSFLITH